MPGRIAWIATTPVKGLALLHHVRVELDAAGIAGDRRFHLADAAGRMFNGKRCGPLVTVVPALDGDRLTLTFPDGSIVDGEVAHGAAVSTRFYGRQRAGRLIEGPWSAALSEHAGEPVTLREADAPAASMDRGRGGAISFLSVAALGPAAAAAGSDGPLDPRRFRMTFGVEDVEASAEDAWIGVRVRVGDAVVRPTQHVGRCLVTSQRPDTGERDLDVLGALGTYRPDDTSAPLALGVAGEVLVPGTVRLGDPVVP